jgi:hypothetical protein
MRRRSQGSFDGGKHFNVEQSLPVTLITGIAIDDSQNIWISSAQCLFRQEKGRSWEGRSAQGQDHLARL